MQGLSLDASHLAVRRSIAVAAAVAGCHCQDLEVGVIASVNTPGEVKAVLTATSHAVAFQAVVDGTQVGIKSMGKNPGMAIEALVLRLLPVGTLIITDKGDHAYPRGAAVTAVTDGDAAPTIWESPRLNLSDRLIMISVHGSQLSKDQDDCLVSSFPRP